MDTGPPPTPFLALRLPHPPGDKAQTSALIQENASRRGGHANVAGVAQKAANARLDQARTAAGKVSFYLAQT